MDTMTLGHRVALAERDQLKAELARALERIAELEARPDVVDLSELERQAVLSPA